MAGSWVRKEVLSFPEKQFRFPEKQFRFSRETELVGYMHVCTNIIYK